MRNPITLQQRSYARTRSQALKEWSDMQTNMYLQYNCKYPIAQQISDNIKCNLDPAYIDEAKESGVYDDPMDFRVVY